MTISFLLSCSFCLDPRLQQKLNVIMMFDGEDDKEETRENNDDENYEKNLNKQTIPAEWWSNNLQPLFLQLSHNWTRRFAYATRDGIASIAGRGHC